MKRNVSVNPDYVGQFSALVVEPDLTDVLMTVSALSTIGFHVTAAEQYEEAKGLVVARPPSVIVTEIRLGEYNGLQLVIRGKTARPRMAAIVTSRFADRVLQAEAERLGATFVLKPTTGEEITAAVLRTLLRAPGQEAPEPVRAPFERRKADRRAAATGEPFSEERRQTERRRDITDLIPRIALLG